MDEKLKRAVSIFNTLGWANANSENIMDLPIGTPEQQKTALEGLKSGAWVVYDSGKTRRYFSIEESCVIAMYAIRVGVTARRVTEILSLYHANKEMLFKVIEARGKKFANDFAAVLADRFAIRFDDYSSETGNITFIMRLMDEMELDIPQNANYIDRWTICASEAMGGLRRYNSNKKNRPSLDLIEKRFTEHIMVGIGLNMQATNGFAAVLATGVQHGYLPREEAIELCLTALDAAVRPGDRAAWIDALDILEIRDEELVQRIQTLIPLLSLGDAKVIERLAPALIKGADETLITEVLLSAFSAPTKKAKALILKTTLTRQPPENPEELAPWISIYASDPDKTISTLGAKLAAKWNIGVEAFPEEEAEITGLWQETPPIWQVPDFELGEVSPEALTELAATITSRTRNDLTHDVVFEQFFALINALALQNPEDARASLRGIKDSDWQLAEITSWVKGVESQGMDQPDAPKHVYSRIRSPIYARNYVVAKNFGKLPCILSTPSKVDLTITFPDLISRLETYANKDIAAQEADLFLAITRLDLKTVPKEPEKSLKKLHVPVVLQSGKTMKQTAVQAILTYIANPVKEPPLEADHSYYQRTDFKNVSKSLGAFPNRLKDGYYERSSIFPTFGDPSLEVKLDGYSDNEKPPKLLQAARRAEPLPPKAAMDILASLGYATLQTAEDVSLAIQNAWERGLLRPGIPDVKYLGGPKTPPTNLVALSTAFDTIARMGILSVIWPLIDEIIVASIAAPRLLPGTAEMCELITTFLPEVKLATQKNIAKESALYLPGIRALAKQKGSSKAVTAAKKAAMLLPEAIESPSAPATEVMNPPFEEVWLQQAQNEILEDGVTIEVDWADKDRKHFLFKLHLPDMPGQVFHIVNSHSLYGLEHGRATATPADIDAPYEFDSSKWTKLFWDTKEKALVNSSSVSWREMSGRSKKEDAPPLSAALITVVIGLIAQDGDISYSVKRLIERLIQEGQLHAKMVRRAVKTLLQSPVVSPAKLVRLLEKDAVLLPVMYPVLTEAIMAAAIYIRTEKAPPQWLNRILDTALRYVPYLKEAASRNQLPEGDARWEGLAEIAGLKSKSTAVAKAKRLVEIV